MSSSPDIPHKAIRDVLYMGLKNDCSFLIDEYLNLYETQSTKNPNMPLRGLFYFSSLYQGYVKSHHFDIYSQVQLRLPTPRYVVFYNGTGKMPERTELRLSDSFIQKAEEETSLECRAVIYNINWGKNHPLMSQCRKLYEYAFFVKEVRDGLSQGMVLSAAVDGAVDDCIEQGVLKDFLLKHKAEVKQMILTEYDEELHIQSEKEIARDEGLRQGLEQGVAALILDNLEEGVPRERILAKLQKRFALTAEAALTYYDKYTAAGI